MFWAAGQPAVVFANLKIFMLFTFRNGALDCAGFGFHRYLAIAVAKIRRTATAAESPQPIWGVLSCFMLQKVVIVLAVGE